MAWWIDWLFWLVGAPVLIWGAWALRRGLFGDPARGRRRCPACWYEVEGVPREERGVCCPECGRVAPTEHELYRTRRRWGLARVGTLALLVGIGAGLTPNVRRFGWTGVVPTTLLLWAPMPGDREAFGGGLEDELFGELWSRHESGGLWGWQEWFLRWRDLDRVIACRDKWPVGQPLCIRLGEGWFASPDAARVMTVTARLPGAQPVTMNLGPTGVVAGSVAPGQFFSGSAQMFRTMGFSSGWPTIGRWDYPHTLVPLPAGTREVTFDIEVREPDEDAPGKPGRLVYSGSVTKRIEAVEDAARVMEPVRSDVIGALIRQGLRIDISRDQGGGAEISAEIPDVTGLRGVVAGLEVQFLHNGEVVAVTRVRPGTDDPITCRGWVESGDLARVADAGPDDPAWIVRVRDSGAAAVRDFWGTKYWVGEFEGALSDFVVRVPGTELGEALQRLRDQDPALGPSAEPDLGPRDRR